MLSIYFSLSVLSGKFRGCKTSNYFFVYFSKAFPSKEYVNLTCSAISLHLEGNIYLPVRYLYLSNFSVDHADIFQLLC